MVNNYSCHISQTGRYAYINLGYMVLVWLLLSLLPSFLLNKLAKIQTRFEVGQKLGLGPLAYDEDGEESDIRLQVSEMCQKLLSNPIIEDFEFELEK